MVKKIFAIIIISILFCSTVNAETYYENSNGVILTKPEYDFIVSLYNENYPSIITIEEYNLLKDKNIFGQEVKRVSTDDKFVNPSAALLNGNGEFHETPYKRLELGCACGDTCVCAATLVWKKWPSARSYDLFGGMQVGSSAPKNYYSHMFVNGNVRQPAEIIHDSTGVSAAHRLPNDITLNSLAFDFSFEVAKRGKVAVTYQHARKNVTLLDTRKFVFNYTGYGHVYLFDRSIRTYYDQMAGLDINL